MTLRHPVRKSKENSPAKEPLHELKAPTHALSTGSSIHLSLSHTHTHTHIHTHTHTHSLLGDAGFLDLSHTRDCGV